MFSRIRRGSAALGLATALLVTVPAPSRAVERGGGKGISVLLRQMESWLAWLWPAPASTDKEGSMIDPNGVVITPTSDTRPDEGSMIDPNGGR